MTEVMPPPILEVRDVSRTFRLSRSLFRRYTLRAVDGVSLALRKRDVLGIVGESGCGKTTLSRIMLGMLGASSGAVLLDGQPIGDYSRRAISRRIQFVFQDPYSSLNPCRTVGETIAQPLRIHRMGDRLQRRQRARELLDVVGLPSRSFDSFPGQLSGGQRQRVIIARALALRPEILICDEPTSALDVSVQSQILNLLLDLRRDFDLSMIMVSHNLSVVEHMATHVAVMYLGRIVEYDEAERLFGYPRHPYTKVLLDSTMTIAPGAGIPNTRLRDDLSNNLNLPTGCRFHPRCPVAITACSLVPPATERDDHSFVECHLAKPRGEFESSAMPSAITPTI